MKIFSINTVPFMAQNKKNNFKPNSVKEDFYSHIKGFLNQNYDKKEYLKLFQQDVDALKKQSVTPIEKKYIDNLLTTLDLTDKPAKISEQYIVNNMKKLLDGKKI